MNADYLLFSDVLRQCLQLDQLAHGIYAKIASRCVDAKQKQFWDNVAGEEASHIKFWEKALVMCEDGHFPIMLENVEDTRLRLVNIRKNLGALIRGFKSFGVPEEEIMLAYTIESYLFDPSFMTIFNGLRFIDSAIVENYEAHIRQFIDVMRCFDEKTAPVKIEILGQTLYNLYMMNKRLLHESATDALTGLLNRRGFFNMISPYLNFASRNHCNAGIIMMDLDNFKQINERHGHPAGDRALAAAAAIIRKNLRKSDIVGRYGGEEFIIFSEAQELHGLTSICERIRKNIESRSERLAGIPFTISLGATVGPVNSPEEVSLSALIERADLNLSHSKATGKNCSTIA